MAKNLSEVKTYVAITKPNPKEMHITASVTLWYVQEKIPKNLRMNIEM
jgi:hypothetical protein